MTERPRQTTRLAIDLDGVLTEHPEALARAANQHFNLALPDSAFVDSTGHSVSLAVREWVYGPNGPAMKLKPNPQARDFLTRVVEHFGYENVRIVTARPASSQQMTVDWLKQYDLNLVGVTFADDKVAVARELGITHAVEDSIRHARSYSAAGITCYFLPNGLGVHPRGIDHPVVDLNEIAERLVHDIEREATAALPRVVISDQIDADARKRIAAAAEIIDVNGTDVPALLAAVADADALIVRSESQVNEAVFAAAPRLRVVARAGVGVDNIDVEAATKAGVLVLNAPGANSTSAADHTLSLILTISRQIIDANATLHAGRWERKRYRPFDLEGKTIGIVGLGRVGSKVAKRLAAFDARLLGYDPFIPAERFQELGVRPASYKELLAASDIVTFHVPSTELTRGMLGRETFPLLQPGAIVINAARGDVVDDQALADALDAGIVAAAGVDVYPHEPVTSSPLWGRPNVVLTPHIGGSSDAALAAVGEVISRSTLAALRGEAVANAVNLPAATLESAELARLTRVAGAAGHLLGVLSSSIPEAMIMRIHGDVAAPVAEHVYLTALSEGLQHWTTTRVTPVNARIVAEQHGIAARIVSVDERLPGQRAGEVDFTFETTGDSAHVVRVRWIDDSVGIVEVDRFSLDRPLAGDMLITHHRDRPGMIGHIGMIMGKHDVNIAGMQVGRHFRGGEAIMVLNVDSVIPQEALLEILAIDDVHSAWVVSLPESEIPWVQEELTATVLAGKID